MIALPSSHPWVNQLHCYDTLDSTNTRAKTLAQNGAPHGTCVFAKAQSQGRGRMGRSFSSPSGLGMYLSVVLRPHCPPAQLMNLTCAVGVAACEAVKQISGLEPGLKWINDLVVDGKKLGGILCELSIDPKTGDVDFAIVGIGVNCLQKPEDFPPELQSLATSLLMQTGNAISPAALAAAMIDRLSRMPLPFGDMDQYRRLCVTLGKPVQVLQADHSYLAEAVSVDDAGALTVKTPDGQKKTVSSGEVSVRGLYGYHP